MKESIYYFDSGDIGTTMDQAISFQEYEHGVRMYDRNNVADASEHRWPEINIPSHWLAI